MDACTFRSSGWSGKSQRAGRRVAESSASQFGAIDDDAATEPREGEISAIEREGPASVRNASVRFHVHLRDICRAPIADPRHGP